MNRIKSLDGIRAISILMVLLGHASETMPSSIKNNSFLFFFTNSSLGVNIFFVISGFLITKLLLIEREKSGSINVKDFYLRRIYRIFPVFFLYIAVILLLKFTIVPTIFTDYYLVAFAALYLWNYKNMFYMDHEHGNGNWFFGHFWSLSMEEQFYLIWPVMFMKIKEETLIKVVLAIIIFMPLARVLTYMYVPSVRGQIGMMLHTGGDSILLGCLAAILERKPVFKDNLMKYLNNGYYIGVLALFLFVISPMLSHHFKGGYNITVGQSINNVVIMIIIFWCIYVPSKVADVLNNAILVRIGVLSYSLYIWQQLFLTDKNKFWVNYFPQNLFIVVGVAFVSYYCVEKPILKLKKRYKKPLIQPTELLPA